MAQAGLHSLSHTVVADGSGRDCLIFQDGGWRHGVVNGRGMEPKFHPMFNRLEKPSWFTTEPPPKALTKNEKSKSLESRSSGASQPRIYRMQNGGTVLYKSKEEIDASASGGMNRSRSAGSLAAAGHEFVQHAGMTRSASISGRRWRTRDTVMDFDSWARKLPMSVDCTGTHPSCSPAPPKKFR
eukprot:TRINITY_DN43012_c0_g1_i1.p1 TRINITY_DN43012_c0_g1~~TRINITY_DN43012_c0_g1_i1.p1  ORF type:complete len:184 (-),score=22.33 TRINITY_DN43012_c0_g1_i1:153-704(-)